MNAITFDTHKVIKDLQSAGIPPQQAEAIVDAFKAAQDGADLATKKDLSLAIAEVKTDLIKWMVGLSLAQIGLLIGILLKITG
jgi:hypothetical protein